MAEAKTRKAKGYEIWVAGGVERAGDDGYRVAASDGGVYGVTLDPDSCECSDHLLGRGRVSKHVFAARFAGNEGRDAGGPTGG